MLARTLPCLLVLLGFVAGPGAAQAGGRTVFRSTSLASATYDARTRILEIEFRSGAIYRYRAVPPAIHEGLLRAESKGRYFSQQIRGRFDFERLPARP